MKPNYNELSDFDKCEMIQEFQEKYYHNYCIEEIDEAFSIINPVVTIINGQYDVWEAYKKSFEEKLKEIDKKNIRR
jgi:hypothetical protein